MKKVTIDETDLQKIFKTDTPLSRFGKFLKRGFIQLVYLAALFLLFFVLLNYSAYWQRLKFDLKRTPTVATVPTPTPTPVQAAPLPDYAPEIIIPKISVDAPIILNVSPAEIVPKLVNGVAHYQDTALPGQIGNTVLVGHSSDFPWSTGHYKTIFALLDKLTAGDEIIVPYQSQRFIYNVTETKVVKDTELSVLAQTDSPTLTLITCYPVGTSQKRLIIRAALVGGQPTTRQETQPYTGANLPTPR